MVYIALLFGFFAAVDTDHEGKVLPGTPWEQEARVPTWEEANLNQVGFMLGWCLLPQVGVGCGGAAFALFVHHGMRQQMSALEQLVCASAPRLSFRHTANVVAWCRLRDAVMWESQPQKVLLTCVVTVSAWWAVLGGAAFTCLRLSGSPTKGPTRYFVVCGWYALVGGLVSVSQLLAVASIDAAIERHRTMLRVELAKNAQIAAAFDATDVEQRNALSTDLRAALAAIAGELEVYDSNPAARYFCIFGVRASGVLKTIGSLLALQLVSLLFKSLGVMEDVHLEHFFVR
jgi:hypothetical protein